MNPTGGPGEQPTSPSEQQRPEVESASEKRIGDPPAESTTSGVASTGEKPVGDPTAEGTASEVASAGEKAAASTTSERKRQSNRENARYSTGPKTARGKNRVRYNPLKHGLYATDVVIREGDGRESQEEFDFLFEGLKRAWNPTNLMQACIVREIAECDWRLRRAHRAEVGEIRRRTDSYYPRLVLPDFDWFDVADGELTDKPLWSRPRSKAVARIARSKVEGQLSTLVDIREEVKQHGYVSEDSQARLESTVGEDDSLPSLCQTFSRLAQYYQSDDEGAKDDPVAADTYKDMLLRSIGAYISRLQDFLFDLESAEDREHEANILAHSLPANVDKLVRYETMLARKKEKAINLLMKLQAKG